MKKPKISIIVISFNMKRELPRTLLTLRAPYQRNIDNDDVEIIVVDNGSKVPVILDNSWENIRYLSYPNPTHSPVAAINYGLSEARAELVGVMIDGARMASPNLVNYAILASKINSKPVISTMAYHLGNEVQMTSVRKGYNQQAEDLLLDSVPWKVDGYRLFDISVFAGSSATGWFKPIAECNALFTTRHLWEDLEGFDNQFKSAGGGLVNLDTYLRATELKGCQLIKLLGEGTFHQVHGGVATNLQSTGATSWKAFHQEYQLIRGKSYKRPEKPFVMFGKVRRSHKKLLIMSCDALK